MAKYKFSPDAKVDLQRIVEYTFDQFGETQVNKYVNSLESCAINLAEEKPGTRRLLNIDPNIRFVKRKHDYIFGILHNSST